MLACNGGGSGTIDAASGTDGSVLDAPAPDAIDGCHALEQTGELIDQIAAAEAPPTPLGGAFPDGRYHLTAETLYTGPGGATGPTGMQHRTTTSCVDLTCDVRAFSVIQGDLTPTTVVFEPDGSDITIRQTCPLPEVSVQITYSTVTDGEGTHVTLYEPFQNRIVGRVYTLQP